MALFLSCPVGAWAWPAREDPAAGGRGWENEPPAACVWACPSGPMHHVSRPAVPELFSPVGPALRHALVREGGDWQRPFCARPTWPPVPLPHHGLESRWRRGGVQQTRCSWVPSCPRIASGMVVWWWWRCLPHVTSPRPGPVLLGSWAPTTPGLLETGGVALPFEPPLWRDSGLMRRELGGHVGRVQKRPVN